MIDFLNKLGLFPEQASAMATRVDGLFAFLFAVTVFFSTLIAVLILTFSIKYRERGGRADESRQGEAPTGSWLLEITWTVIPLAIAMGIFVWGASIYFAMSKPPEDALEVFVVGRQWMWKLQHMQGRREINELHVPVGRAVKLTMTSEDVIHSFYVPAFRMKFDALPGRYTSAWFTATKEGSYHLFCAEYCGTQHSRMIGRVVVMPMGEYQEWLKASPAPSGGAVVPEARWPLAALGERLFESSGCKTCHATSPAEGATAATGPPLYGLFGRTVALESGREVVANEDYLRQAILDPMAAIVKGYRPMMPTYAGRLSEEDVLRLIAFIKSRADEPTTAGAPQSVGAKTTPDGSPSHASKVPEAEARRAAELPEEGQPIDGGPAPVAPAPRFQAPPGASGSSDPMVLPSAGAPRTETDTEKPRAGESGATDDARKRSGEPEHEEP